MEKVTSETKTPQPPRNRDLASSPLDATAWHDFPMGPSLRAYLGIKDRDYRGYKQQAEAREKEFELFFRQCLETKKIKDQSELLSILEELVGMRFPKLALFAQQLHPEHGALTEFRGLLALGAAAMLLGDLDQAEEWLLQAQGMAPDELAPYTNLAQIYFHSHRDEESWQCLETALSLEANSRQVWELIARVKQALHPATAANEVRQLARDHASWAGSSLAAIMSDENDPLLRAQWLEEFHSQGLQDPEFLIEYTAALGIALQYEKIPPIVWQAKGQLDKGKSLPWQLYAHAAQAQIATENHEEARKLLDLALVEGTSLTDEVRRQLEELKTEAESNLQPTNENPNQESQQ